jgi:hypothetical protein
VADHPILLYELETLLGCPTVTKITREDIVELVGDVKEAVISYYFIVSEKD